MSHRVRRRAQCFAGAFACAMLACVSTTSAHAQSRAAVDRLDDLAVVDVRATGAHAWARGSYELPRRHTIQPLRWPAVAGEAGRPKTLVPLYVSFGALQALDAHSTLRAVGAGHSERNPLVDNFTTAPGAMVGLKLASTAGTIYLAERLWRRHRGAAIALMVAVNGAYAAVVMHNYRTR